MKQKIAATGRNAVLGRAFDRIAKKLAIGAALAAPLVMGSPARAANEQTSIAIPAYVVLFLSEYVAEDQHLWEQEGLDVKVQFIAGVGAMNAVIAGSTDFSMSSGGSLTRAASHGQNLLAIANMGNQNGQYIVLRKDIADAAHFNPTAPLAERAKLLKGRIIGIDAVSSVVHAVVKVVAKAGGVDPDSITVAPMQPADTLSAFTRHAIDGFAGGPPWTQQVVTDGTAVVISDGGIGEPKEFSPIGSVMVITRPQFCAEHRSICVKMGHVMKLAADFIHEHPQESIAILKKRYQNVDDAVLKASYDAVVEMTPQPPVPDATQLANAENMNVAARFMKPEEKLKSYDALFSADFAR
jgi:ABC-type nitrate/sulfonate/bicarbonate transport system substrate-binding protein